MVTIIPIWLIGVLLAVVALVLGLRIVRQYEGGVMLRFGRLVGVRAPGLNFIVPIVDRMYRIDTRTVTLTVEPQEVITRDNVTIKVDAVVYFSVLDPAKALLQVVDYVKATSQIALTTLRSVLGQSELDELLAHREKINQKLQQIIDEHTEPWGVKVSVVEVKDVLLPESMQRSMAAQAEAERRSGPRSYARTVSTWRRRRWASRAHHPQRTAGPAAALSADAG
jgi:regulator of protease activity HflC (stomatin/prohibitin superfamily)